MKRVCVVTGTRAEYGILKPVLRAIDVHDWLDLRVVVAGMHLAPEFGLTVEEIERDGFPIAGRVEMHPRDDSGAEMSDAVGRGVRGFSQAFSELEPEGVLVLGDRIEALAAAVAAAYQNLVLAHVHGGDTSRAGLDESARHAITKFAHLHFPATPTSADRIRKLGENPTRIHLVGSPSLDSALARSPIPFAELAEELRLPVAKGFVLFVQHPVTTQAEAARAQVRETLAALEELSRPVVGIYPNSDCGSRAMIDEIKQFSVRYSPLRLFRSLPHAVYQGALRHASVLVGNSSSGIIEAASFELPVVDIGMRQAGRERARNVVSVPPDREAILAALRTTTAPEFRDSLRGLTNPYGDGNAAPRIARILAETERSSELLQKQIAY